MTPLKLNEDEMADIKRDAIEQLRPYLCEKLMAVRHFDYLRSKKILSKDDAEEIMSHTTSTRRAGELLDRVVKNPKGLDALIESIRLLGTQDFLIDKITDEVLRVKNVRLESYKGCCSSPSPITGSNGIISDLYRQHSSDGKLLKPEMESTVLHHPEGESSLLAHFNTMTFSDQSMVENRTRSTRLSSPVSPRLPRPGELGAPPLPVTLPQEHEDDSASFQIDSKFLPLRSTSPFNPR